MSCNLNAEAMKKTESGGFEPPEFGSLDLVRIDFSEWRPYVSGLHAMDFLATTRSEFVEVMDLKDKRSGPAVSIRVTSQGGEIDDDSDYETVFEKAVKLSRVAVVESEGGAAKFAIALHLEGTLISNGVSQFPRLGLWDFLEGLNSLGVEVVICSTLSQLVADEVLRNLQKEDAVPEWFLDCRRVPWRSRCKSIHDVLPGKNYVALLVDDYEGYVCPGGEEYWMEVPTFSSPYQEGPGVLTGVLRKIEAILFGVFQV